ncbi:MAG TPA: DUF4856 domain-containing protein [Bacteroidia bacterium]
MRTIFNKSILLAIPAIVFMASCKKDTPETTTPTTPTTTTPTYTVPATYNKFTNVDYASSKKRIAMLGEMITYIRTAHTTTATPVLSAVKLKDMYANANAQFTDANLNTSGIQLKDQTSSLYNLATDLDASFDSIAAITQTTPNASSGVGGKLVSGTSAYIVDANGLEFKELVEKGIMGGVFYSRATIILSNIGTYDNSTVTNGSTAQERAWDEAFGYFGVPDSFPLVTTGVKNWGSYCNSVSVSLTGSSTNASSFNVIIMNAFLKGRAAISNKDNTVRDEQKQIIIKTWEKVGAARFITYVKQAKTNIADDGKRSHLLSEGVGFIKAFRYNSSKTITDAQINTLLGYFGTNFYNVTTTNLDNAINDMATIFGLDASKL